MVMELVSPLTFTYTYLKHAPRPFSLDTSTILAAAFLLHYLNRALISPLRTPSRSKAHFIVPLFGISFNLMNGYLQGAFLATSPLPLTRPRPAVVLGLSLWALGLAGNIYHDEILLDVRRNTRYKGGPEVYSIPRGGLYSWVSYPNYLCEWVEWAGFAWAAAPPPWSLSALLLSLLSLPFRDLRFSRLMFDLGSWHPTYPAPYAFLLAEICTMLPRAHRGHRWYRRKFGIRYPKERWAILPGLV